MTDTLRRLTEGRGVHAVIGLELGPGQQTPFEEVCR